MVGSATLMIVKSTTIIKNETASSEKARQRRTSPGTRVSATTTPLFAPDAWPRGPALPPQTAGSAPARSVTEVETAPSGNWAGGERPVSRSGGLYMCDHGARNGRAAMRGWPGERGSADAGPGGRRAGVRRVRRAVPARAAGALLPVPRLGAGRRGRGAGDAAGGLAGPGRVRGSCLGPDLAVPGGDQPLPARAAIG